MIPVDYSDDRLNDLFAAIDARDGDAFVAFLTPNGSFRFGSAPAARGRDAIRDAVAGFFSSIAGCRHTLDKTIRDGNTIVCEGMVTYLRLDDLEVSVPFIDVFELDGDLIDQYKIYIDISPLYQE